MSYSIALSDYDLRRSRYATGFRSPGFGGVPAGGERLTGSPDFEDVAEDGTATPGAWATGLDQDTIDAVYLERGDVVFTLDEGGNAQVYRDALGRLVTPKKDLLGLPWWAWALGLGALAVSS